MRGGRTWRLDCNMPNQTCKQKTAGLVLSPGTSFSKVPIINGPGKLSPFTLKIEVSIVLHLA